MDPASSAPLKPDVFHILLVLLDGPRHGYALMQEVRRSSEGELRLLPGALYRRLQQLLDRGLIEEVEDPKAVDSRRRVYAVTTRGRTVAASEAARLERLVAAAARRNLLPDRGVPS